MNKSAIAFAIAASIAAIITLLKPAGDRSDQLVSKLRKLEIGMTMSQVKIVLHNEVDSRKAGDYKKSIWFLNAANVAGSERPFIVFDSTGRLIYGSFDGNFEIGKYPELLFMNMNKDDSSNLEKWIGNINPL